MAPYPSSNASSTLSPSLNPSHQSQPTAFQLGAFNQNQWGPDAIGTIFFGVVMFFIGVTALWQGRPMRLRHEEDEEQGRGARDGARPSDSADEIAMEDLDEEMGSERVAVGTDEPLHGENTMERGYVKIERARRTDTEGTLVGHDEDESEVKEVED